MIALAHTAYDGTRTYRDRRRRDVAYAGSAAAILTLGRDHPAWRAFGSPTQADGMFLLVAPEREPEDIPLDAGAEGWLALAADDVAEFND